MAIVECRGWMDELPCHVGYNHPVKVKQHDNIKKKLVDLTIVHNGDLMAM